MENTCNNPGGIGKIFILDYKDVTPGSPDQEPEKIELKDCVLAMDPTLYKSLPEGFKILAEENNVKIRMYYPAKDNYKIIEENSEITGMGYRGIEFNFKSIE
jgi:hypothetical protein